MVTQYFSVYEIAFFEALATSIYSSSACAAIYGAPAVTGKFNAINFPVNMPAAFQKFYWHRHCFPCRAETKLALFRPIKFLINLRALIELFAFLY